MTTAASQDSYGNAYWGRPSNGRQNGSAWGSGPNQNWGTPDAGGPHAAPFWGGPPWAPFLNPAGFPRGVAIAITVLGFMFWWPVGLAVLFYMIGSGRMGCFGRRRRAMAHGRDWQDAGPFSGWKAWACGGNDRSGHSSGNRAFDEYKADTLRRMEEEQQEFGAFLERLRFAKDKAEFDEFMAERRNRPPAPPTQEQPSA